MRKYPDHLSIKPALSSGGLKDKQLQAYIAISAAWRKLGVLTVGMASCMEFSTNNLNFTNASQARISYAMVRYLLDTKFLEVA